MSRRSRERYYAEKAKLREVQHKRTTNSGYDDNMPRPFNGEKSEDSKSWARYKAEQLAMMPKTLPTPPEMTVIQVYVEGYEDISFWRAIFDDFETDRYSFEISVPPRDDLAKGKMVLMNMIPESSQHKLLCIDSDFDYLFGEHLDQSKLINNSPYMFHTYAYSTENYLCYAPSLHNLCVKATKNDARIFDFDFFLAEYSKIIYPLFLWYSYSAMQKTENLFTLHEFKSSVKLNYLEVENNGVSTLEWLKRQVEKRLHILENRYPDWEYKLKEFEKVFKGKAITPETTYLFMHGHTLLDNVIIVILNAVCEQLKLMSNIRITTSTKTGTALKNELSNYNNAQRNVRDILQDNELYKISPLYKMLQRDIESYMATLK